MPGWCGKILRIDLSDNRITTDETERLARLFLGGRGLATKIYWDEVGPEVGAFDAGNKIIIMAGPLVATGVQGATRCTVISKSPMLNPEGFSYGNLGGFFPSELRKAGFDGMVISGKASEPSLIVIRDEAVEICDAAALWGKGTYEVGSILRGQYGQDIKYISTGLAGENLCRNATIISDHEGSVTSGFGAVFGSKKLKAIAVSGSGSLSVAWKEKLQTLNRRTVLLSKRLNIKLPLPKEQITYLKKSPCAACGLDCQRGLFRTNSGQEAIRKCHSMTFYMPWVYRRKDEHIDTSFSATALCNDYALCTMEIQNIIEWLQGCEKKGRLTEKDTGINLSALGSLPFITQLTSMIAKREGFGNILAEGVMRASAQMGENVSDRLTVNMSGGGIGLAGGYAPREYPITALLYAFEPRQPIAMLHEVVFHVIRWLANRTRPDLSPTTTEVFRKAAGRFWGGEEAGNFATYDGKALGAAKIQDRTYVKDSLGLCDFAWPIMDSFNTPDHVGDPELPAQIFSAVTGREVKEDDLHLFGERIFNLQRSILLREGRKPKESDLPPDFNFTKPVSHVATNPQLIVPGSDENPVSIKGNTLDRNRYESLRREYYLIRKWDPDSGRQKKSTLDRLGLSDVAAEMNKLGFLEL
jgi:aldehyde:ferredoxin oxidoreductase